jgi:hypothetical protein
MVLCEDCNKTRASFGRKSRTPKWCKSCSESYDDAWNVNKTKPKWVTELEEKEVDPVEEEKVEEEKEEEVEPVEQTEEEMDDLIESKMMEQLGIVHEPAPTNDEDEKFIADLEEQAVQLQLLAKSRGQQNDQLKREINSLTTQNRSLNKLLEAETNSVAQAEAGAQAGSFLTKSVKRDMVILSQKVSKTTKILDDKVVNIMDKLDVKMNALKEQEDKIKEEIKTLSDAKTRCEEFNSSVCYINILLNEKLIWNVSSNQADSKIVNVITSELKTCESPYKNNVSKILKKYKFELKAKRVASFAEYWSQKDQKGRGIQREAVFDYVYVRSYC